MLIDEDLCSRPGRVANSKEEDLITMERLIFVGAVTVALILGPGSAFSDEQPKPNRVAKRPVSKPSIWKTWRDEMRSLVQEQIHTARYIRGHGPPEYDRP